MRNFLILLLCVVFALTVQASKPVKSKKLRDSSNGKNYEVQTLGGTVKGFVTTSCKTQKPFAKFRGIPYAEPPLGKLRFKDPVEKQKWEGVWDGTFERPGCLQGSVGGDSKTAIVADTGFSEDCLYLNVFTPNLKYLETKKAPLKAVMVFIHMGAFNMGSSAESVTSPDFLIDKDVVVVTFNYRLGAFGFFSLQNVDVPGNAGLKDQNLALRWVKNNIKNFGGDPKKITIFGESAGAASVNYHMLSRSSEGLFRSAIIQSGSAITPWAYSPPELSLKKALRLGKKLNCHQKDMHKFLECMQNAPADRVCELQQKALTLEELLSLRIIAFHPTIEPPVPGAFITTPPFDLLNSGNFTRVPVIIGSNADEGLLLYPALRDRDPYGFLLTLLGMDLSRFAPHHLGVKPLTGLAIHVHREISRFYFEGKMITKAMMNNVLQLLADVMFILPIQLTASLLSTSSTVYNYAFTYDGSYALYKASSDMMKVPGVCHGDDLGYIFYTPELHQACGRNDTKMEAADELTIDRMTRLWTDFAKTGNPTPKPDKTFPYKWMPFTAADTNYMDIGKDLVCSKGVKLANMIFWDHLIKEIKNSKNGHLEEIDVFSKLYG